VYSATVLAPTAALADGLATALYVMGPDAAARFCQARADVAVFMVCRAEEGRTTIRSSGFAADELMTTSSA
jgi:thiamine biosynthesis lipoprotein ApbE